MIAFDDGPLETTEAVLNILKLYGVRATFFVVGDRIADGSTLLRMVDEGHVVENHGWSHRPLIEMPLREAAWEIERTAREIELHTGIRPTAFRPPFIRWLDPIVDVAKALGHPVVELESSVGDWNDMTPEHIIDEARKCVTERRTIWLHDGVDATVQALPAICEMLA